MMMAMKMRVSWCDYDDEDDDQDDCVENDDEEDIVAHPKNQADLGEDEL